MVTEKKEESKTDKLTANEPSAHEQTNGKREGQNVIADYQYAWCCDYCKRVIVKVAKGKVLRLQLPTE